jgi:ribonuclease HII
MPSRPSLQRERAAWAGEQLVVGVDEAGRGPLAGPVVAAAVVFPPGASAVRGLRDSKMLLPAVRGKLAQRIRQRVLGFGIGAASSREIDRLNIRVATALAMRRAIEHLFRQGRVAPTHAYYILIDGLPLPEIGYPHQALVDGDARCHSISAAAILAKTVRDLLMQRLAPRYPVYGWDHNVGYGTAEHQESLRLHGPTRHHRITFAPIAQHELAL